MSVFRAISADIPNRIDCPAIQAQGYTFQAAFVHVAVFAGTGIK